MSIGQSDGSNSLVEVPSSLVALVCKVSKNLLAYLYMNIHKTLIHNCQN